MDAAAEQLRAISKVIADHPVEVQADTHYIELSGPDTVIDQLVAEELATILQDEDDFDGPDEMPVA